MNQDQVVGNWKHVANERAIAMLNRVHALLQRIKATTAQWLPSQRWTAIASEIASQILALKPKPTHTSTLLFSG